MQSSPGEYLIQCRASPIGKSLNSVCHGSNDQVVRRIRNCCAIIVRYAELGITRNVDVPVEFRKSRGSVVIDMTKALVVEATLACGIQDTHLLQGSLRISCDPSLLGGSGILRLHQEPEEGD